MNAIIKILLKQALEDSLKTENLEIMEVVEGKKEISFK